MTDQTEILVELGVEEIPGRMMETALDQLGANLRQWAEEHRLSPDPRDMEVFGTPRRLVVAGRFPSRQREATRTLKGPPEEVAYEDGEPSQALAGFCRQHGLSPDEVSVEEMDGGRYIQAEVSLECRNLESVVQESIEDVFLGLDWPKTLRWEESGTRFIRPIRWVLAACRSKGESEFLDLTVGPVESEPAAHGLRFTELQVFQVDPSDLFDAQGFPGYPHFLKDRTGIVLDQDQRRQTIETEAEQLAEEVEGTPVYSAELLDEVNHLVEVPTPFRGEFDDRFLQLPDEVLVESMQSHQKYFPVRGDNGLLPYFIGVRNGTMDHLSTVVEGNQKVLRARLNDAEFFYRKDLETDYEEYRPQLEGVVFQEELGSLLDKTDRLNRLVGEHLDRLEADLPLDTVARHCKNDLVTEMVDEFPALQGVMGRIYAGSSGWDEEQARIIEDHYRPRDREDPIPASPPAQLLAVLDRIDTLVGFFGLGERPTGSADPYGLRRDALGVLRILLDGSLPRELSLLGLLEQSHDQYRSMESSLPDEFRSDLESFFEERLLNLAESDPDHFEAVESQDTFHRLLRATVPPFWDRPRIAEQRYDWLSRPEGEFQEGPREDFLEAYQRADNILQGEDKLPEQVDEARFEDPAEAQLKRASEELGERLDEHLQEGNSREVFQALWELIDPINGFFEAVMVHAEDPEVRDNRLRLLEEVRDQCRRVADFSVI